MCLHQHLTQYDQMEICYTYQLLHTVKMCNFSNSAKCGGSCRHQITKEIFQVPNFATRAHFLSSLTIYASLFAKSDLSKRNSKSTLTDPCRTSVYCNKNFALIFVTRWRPRNLRIIFANSSQHHQLQISLCLYCYGLLITALHQVISFFFHSDILYFLDSGNKQNYAVGLRSATSQANIPQKMTSGFLKKNLPTFLYQISIVTLIFRS